MSEYDKLRCINVTECIIRHHFSLFSVSYTSFHYGHKQNSRRRQKEERKKGM